MTFSDDALSVFFKHSELSFNGLTLLATEELAKARRALESATPTDAHEVAKFQAQIAAWKGLLSLPSQLQKYAAQSAAPHGNGQRP